MLVTSALKEECVVVVMAWSVLMLMLCSFLQFEICGALEYLISHLITPGRLSWDSPDQGREWDIVKIFSISERLTPQWNISLWNYINSHHYVGCCLLAVPPNSLSWSPCLLVSGICMKLLSLDRVVCSLCSGVGGHQRCVTGRRLGSHSPPVSSPSSSVTRV